MRFFFFLLSFPTLKLFQAFSDRWGFCSWLILVETLSSVWAGLGSNWGGSTFSCYFRPSHIWERVAGFKPRRLLLTLKPSMAFGTDYICDIPRNPCRGGSPTGCHQGNVTGTNFFCNLNFFPPGHQTNLKEFTHSSGWETDDGEVLGPQVVNLTLKTCFLLISSLMTNLSFYKWNWIAPN